MNIGSFESELVTQHVERKWVVDASKSHGWKFPQEASNEIIHRHVLKFIETFETFQRQGNTSIELSCCKILVEHRASERQLMTIVLRIESIHRDTSSSRIFNDRLEVPVITREKHRVNVDPSGLLHRSSISRRDDSIILVRSSWWGIKILTSGVRSSRSSNRDSKG